MAEIPSEGEYNEAGDWVKGESIKETLRGAIIAHRENKIFRSSGTLTSQDKALYMLRPIKNSLHGAKVVHNGNVYHIGDLLENSEFTGVYAYTLKFVSAFSEVGENG